MNAGFYGPPGIADILWTDTPTLEFKPPIGFAVRALRWSGSEERTYPAIPRTIQLVDTDQGHVLIVYFTNYRKELTLGEDSHELVYYWYQRRRSGCAFIALSDEQLAEVAQYPFIEEQAGELALEIAHRR